jgi:hypothetical protein
MTVVPASPALPAVVAHLVKKARKRCTWLEQIKEPSWLKGSWSDGGVWAYPRVLVLPGDVPKAQGLDRQKLSRTDLPAGTKRCGGVGAIIGCRRTESVETDASGNFSSATAPLVAGRPSDTRGRKPSEDDPFAPSSRTNAVQLAGPLG